jgi:hypothetical protein
MRSDLRKLFWRFREGLIRPSVVEEAVDAACSRLVSERFRQEGPLQETSTRVQPVLAEFENRVAYARLWLQAGEHRRAVLAVEEAEKALAGAHEMARAEGDWRSVGSSWRELSETFGLAAFPKLATVRVAERSLVVAEKFLDAGEARKAHLVARQLRVGLDRLRQRVADGEPRAPLIRLLVTLRSSGGPPVEGLSIVAGRLADAGLLELAQRLVEDWQAVEGEGHRDEAGQVLPPASFRSGVASSAGRFEEIEREASRLASVLAGLAAGEASSAGAAAATTGTEKEVE